MDFVKLTQNSKDFITLKLQSTRVNSSFDELVGTNSRKRSIASIEEGEDNQEGDREGAAASSSAASSSSAAADPAPRALEEMYGSHDENEDEEDSDERDDVYTLILTSMTSILKR